MTSSPRTGERREVDEGRLNLRTLTIASAASATAAAVTSQLWIAGTWIAAALTPVLVALISEAMHRPTDRLARWTTERPPRAPRPAVGSGPGPVRVYRQPQARRRRIAVGAVAVTAVIAFVVAIGTITIGDLVAGGSIGKGSAKTTLFTGGDSSAGQGDDSEQQPQDGATQTEPAQPAEPDEETPPTTSTPPAGETAPAPVPAPTEPPPGEPAPEAPPTP